MAPPLAGQTAYTLAGVFNELARFKKSIDNNTTHECENYVPIRLVTIIEQFFRVMMKLGRLGRITVRKQKDLKKKVWVPKAISITTLVDIFVHNDTRKMIETEDYEEFITQFCDDQSNNCEFNTMTYNVEFNDETEIKKLVEYVLPSYDHDIFEWIAVHTHSFQSPQAIKQYAGTLFDDDATAEKYSQLFDTRHIAVHTFNGKPLDPNWFNLVSDLFVVVEKEHP